MDAQLSQERAHLADTIAVARAQIALLREELRSLEADIKAAQEQLRGETAHTITGSLWNSESFEALTELSQFSTDLSVSITHYETTRKNLDRLTRLLPRPYFARIDFTFENDTHPLPVYIGRHALMENHHVKVHDWRSPIAGLFYSHGLGAASYQAPGGTMTGRVERKRQYEITAGQLDYFLDVDVEIVDAQLRKMLSHNASATMKSIVETIAREQDAIIRDRTHDALFVQGVAGSGKTSVALHRVAYLLYSGLTGRLTSQSVAILSPNDVFETYISNVLPELGEENVQNYILEELLTELLHVKKLQTRAQLLEHWQIGPPEAAAISQHSCAFKGSAAFVRLLNALTLPKTPAVQTVRAAYTHLFTTPDALQQLAASAGVALPNNSADIIRYTAENLRSRTLFFDDASAMAYLLARHHPFEAYTAIRQLVIDEAQDYSYLHYALFRALFPAAKYTILGDVHQALYGPVDAGFYAGLAPLFPRQRTAEISLEKSFRSSREIMQYSARLLGRPIATVDRAGHPVTVCALKSEADTAPLIAHVRQCQADGLTSIGICCASQRDGRALYHRIQDALDVRLLSDTERALSGVFILPVYVAKGLEFDASLVWGATAQNYGTARTRQHLFVACTRALHRLIVYHWGAPSPFLPADQ